jgi:hypothetical protein
LTQTCQGRARQCFNSGTTPTWHLLDAGPAGHAGFRSCC